MAVPDSIPLVAPQELSEAMDFALAFFERAHQDNRLRGDTYQNLVRYYRDQRERLDGGYVLDNTVLRPRSVCWSCRLPVGDQDAICPGCGVPVQGDRVDRLRRLVFLCFEIKKHEKAGRLPLALAHNLLADANGRVAALRHNLELERAPLVEAVGAAAGGIPLAPTTGGTSAPPAEKPRPVAPVPEPVLDVVEAVAERPAKPPIPRRSLLEILLDPRSIHWLLACGGALLVLGLIIYLATQGLFEDKLFVAVLLGAGNAVLLAGGWALILGTRYQGTGRALTLLACLLMPFNLWFYDAQKLIPLAEGGHLWIPALVCCVLYAVSARLLKDVLFVPVLVLGIAGTGLLLLADSDLHRFWEIAAPASLLVVLGLLCIHAERIFPDSADSPFSRKRFGLAFFWSGQALLGAGLLLVLGAQVVGGWLYPAFEPLFRGTNATRDLVTTPWGRWTALGLVLAGTYAYLYSDLVVRRVGVYIYLAVFTLLWAEALVINLFPWPIPTEEIAIIALAVTALILNLAIAASGNKKAVLFRAGPPLALILSTLPVLIALVLHLRATLPGTVKEMQYDLTGSYVAALAVTIVSCRFGAFLYRHKSPALSVIYFFGTAAATLMGAAGLLVWLRPGILWEEQAPLLMLIPILYVLAARLYRGHTPEKPLVWVAHASTGVMLWSCLGTAFKGFVLVQGQPLNLLLAVFFAEAAVFYVLTAWIRSQAAGIYLCTAMACAAVWQLLNYWGVPPEYYTLAFALVGLALLIGYRLALLERYGNALAAAAFGCANALLSLAFVAAALMTLNELLTRTAVRDRLVPLLGSLLGISLLAVALVRQQGWRRWYVVATIVNMALTVLVLVTGLEPGQVLEIVCLVVGVSMLLAAHLGWFREQERHDDLVSLGLFFGGLLVALPLTITTLSYRVMQLSQPAVSFDTFHIFNEVGMLLAGLLLLSTGFVFRLRFTTIFGAIMTILYVLTLPLFVRLPHRLQATAVYLMIGGGVFFGLGLLLSIYRDRLLTLPERIKRREGIFKILSWR